MAASLTPLLPRQLLSKLLEKVAQGEVATAVSIYEQSGGTLAGPLLEQLSNLPQTCWPTLASVFENAREYFGAAQVREAMGDSRTAAHLYDQGGHFDLAAKCHTQHGDWQRAAVALERGGHWPDAARLYQASGAQDACAQCLARHGAFAQAAQVHQQTGNLKAEVDMLMRVAVNAPERIPAVKRLLALLEHFGHGAQAVQLLQDTFHSHPNSLQDPDLVALHGRLEPANAPVPVVEVAAVETVAPGRPHDVPKRTPEANAMRAVMVSHNDRINALVAPGRVAPEAETPFGSLENRPQAASDTYSSIKGIPLFSQLAHGDMEALHQLSVPVNYPVNAVILEQGAPGLGLWVVLAGSVGVARVEVSGVMTPVAVLGPGDCVGEISLLDDGPATARVLSQSPVSALFIAKDRFHHFVATRDAAALKIYRVFARTLAERMRHTLARM